MAEVDVDVLKWYAKIGVGCPELQGQLPAIIAVLEDRDRLRAAAEAVLSDAEDYTDECNIVDARWVVTRGTVGRLRAALEGRDGSIR